MAECARPNITRNPIAVLSRDRLVVRTLRCGRSNPGSNPGHGMDKIFGGLEIDNEEVFPRKRQQDTSSGYSLTKAPTFNLSNVLVISIKLVTQRLNFESIVDFE